MLNIEDNTRDYRHNASVSSQAG